MKTKTTYKDLSPAIQLAVIGGYLGLISFAIGFFIGLFGG